MPRRSVVRKKRNQVDPLYNDALVARCIAAVMRRGKKALAERIVYGAFEILRAKTGKEPLEVFRKAIDNLRPSVEVKSRRVGGSTYQVPVEVHQERRTALAIRWLVGYSKQRRERTMREKLAGELFDAFKNEGSAVKKREDTHRMAEANKAFAHYRW
ncbi:MAG: 30S ribosomal protein S7 [Myxococcota bacterium]